MNTNITPRIYNTADQPLEFSMCVIFPFWKKVQIQSVNYQWF